MKNFKNITSLSEKNSSNKQWFKDHINLLENRGNISVFDGYGIDYHTRIKVNYDLFNNIIDPEEFSYVCQPYGAKVGKMPAKFTNKDISSPKIKAILGMEMGRPFTFNAIAVNPEATTRKEQEEFKRMRDYVVSQIMTPIRQEIEQRKQAETLGRELTEEEIANINKEIEAELEANTPQEVRKYMKREHQDPAEVLTNQLLKYFIQKNKLKKEFNKAFKHSLLSSAGLMFVGNLNGEVRSWAVNSMNFRCDMTSEQDFVEDKEWATCMYNFSPTKLVELFGDELSKSDLDNIYSSWQSNNYWATEDLFAMVDAQNNVQRGNGTGIPTLHTVWKSLRKMGFLTYKDRFGKIQEKLVDETYKLNKDFGDIKIKWTYIPEVYEGWKIMTPEPIYVCMRPIPGQHKDINNLFNCKLPYYGYYHDNLNSVPTALMDRLKYYQYSFSIVLYKLETLISSDKGKKVLMNIGSIPTSEGVDLNTWQYYFEATPFVWYNPKEEGNDGMDANNVAKVIDLSLVSDIQKYIEIAEYIRKQAGQSVGIPDHVEGQAGPNESVGNVRQNLVQSSYILEPYFDLHNILKQNVLQALVETAKVTYAGRNKFKLSYVLDDLSIESFDVDPALLDNSTLGIFVSNTPKIEEVKDLILQLSHAALQNQTVEFSDVISVAKQDSLIEAEETLKEAEATRRRYAEELEKQKHENTMEQINRNEEIEERKHEREKEKIVLKEEERRKTVIAQSSLTGMSFNPDQDSDKDGINDFLEIAKHGLNADVKAKELELKEKQLDHNIKQSEVKNQNEAEKLKIMKAKNAQKSVKA